MFFAHLVIAAIISTTAVQRPPNTPICDYYTTALLKNNTAANQKSLLTIITRNSTSTPGTYNGIDANLTPYFDGGFASSNHGGDFDVSMNFLDSDGAAPLMKNMPANDTMSDQYSLLTHLYEFFGALLGCSMQGGADYSAYEGEPSMYEVHKFMGLSAAEVGYFVTQVANSAASFGVAKDDLTVVGTVINSLFCVRCPAPITVVPAQGPQLQAICIDSTCP